MATIIYKKFFKSKEAVKPATCVHQREVSVTPCIECKAQKSNARKYRWKIILGLVAPYALQGLDATIIASALPWIGSDFNKTSQQNWIASAFNLTAAAFIPFWAQIADVFGRNVALNAAIIMMLIGSALCTGAPTQAFPVLLLGRGFQGMAASGLNVLVRTVLADKVSLSENAKNWTIFAFIGGTAYALGPVIGGYLTSANWRWCFAINLPIAALALLVTFFVLRKELLGPQPIPELNETALTGRRTKLLARLKTIDVGGQALFLFGFGLVILALTWGGVTYPWSSAAVLAPLIVGCALVGCFFCWERMLSPGNTLSRRMPWQRPMIPWHLLTNRDMGLIFYMETTTGMATFAVLYFCNIYFIAVKNYSSDKAGLQLLYFTPGIATGVFLCSFMCNKWPRMTFPPLFLGTIVEAVGLGVLTWALYMEKTATIFGMMAMVGVGMGLRFMAAPLHGIGNFKEHRAAVIGLVALSIPFGGTIGLTIMSTVFNNTSGLDSNGGDFSMLGDLPDDVRSKTVHDAKMGVVWAFVAINPFLIVACLCSLFLGNVQFGRGTGADDDARQDFIIREVYLLTLLRGRRVVDEEERAIRLETPTAKDASKASTSAEDSGP